MHQLFTQGQTLCNIYFQERLFWKVLNPIYWKLGLHKVTSISSKKLFSSRSNVSMIYNIGYVFSVEEGISFPSSELPASSHASLIDP